MNFICIQLEGAHFCPISTFLIDDFWIVPASKPGTIKNMTNDAGNIVIAFKEEGVNFRKKIKLFVLCYQFLFLQSHVYYYFSRDLINASLIKPATSILFMPFKFIENAVDIEELVNNLEPTYSIRIDFNKIESVYSGLSNEINFNLFHENFVKKYEEDLAFKEIIDLYLYTIGEVHPLYQNTYQKISQLQTVLEGMLGRIEQTKLSCGFEHNKYTWAEFITKKLNQLGITNENDIKLIIKIRKILSDNARNIYIHAAKKLDKWEKIENESKASNHYKQKSGYTTNFEDIINNKLKVENWAEIDWMNVYLLYQNIIKNLIYRKYLT